MADRIDLRELRYFAAAVRTGNLARAAQDLNVSASAISQQLHKLEGELGTPLLVRHGRGVIATQAGCRLLERVDAVVRLLNAPLGPEDPRAAPTGALSLAIPAELAGVVTVPVLAALRERLPDLTPTIKESIDGGVDSWLLAGQVDLAVLPDPSDVEELEVEPILADPIGVVVGPRSRLAETALPMRLRDLDSLPLILPGKRHWLRRMLARAAFQRGLRCEPAFEVDSLAATRDLVRHGLGCAVLPRAAVREETARGALVFRPLEQPGLAATYAVAFARPAPWFASDAARAVRCALGALAADGTWTGARPIQAHAVASTQNPGSDDAERPRRRPRPMAAEDTIALAAGD